MTYNEELTSLRNEINSLLDVVKTNAEAKVETDKREVLSTIQSLHVELGQDYDPKEFESATISELNFGIKQLKKAVGMLSKGTDNTMSKLFNRESATSLSKEELEDKLTDMISLAYFLPIADKEIKEQVRYERMSTGFYLN